MKIDDFNHWMDILKTEAVSSFGFSDRGASRLSPEYFLPMFEEGKSPQEALQESTVIANFS